MNASVTATGMVIKAQSSSNLLIAHTATATAPEDSAYKNSENLSADYSTPVELAPGTTVNLTNWYTSTALVPTAYSSAGSYTAGVLNTNYIEELLWFKSGANCNLYLASAEFTGTNVAFGVNSGNSVGKFFNSLRIGILMSDGTFRIYAPDAGTAANAAYDMTNTEGYGYGTVGSSTGRNVITNFTAMTKQSGEGMIYNGANTATFGTLDANVGKLAHVFIWFEGEDGACYTNNINLNNVTINLTFAKVDIVPGP